MLSNIHPRFIEPLMPSAILALMSKRFLTAAAAVCLSLSAVAGGGGDVHPAQNANAAPADSPPAVPPADAAQKHARRTACLTSAKNKKLVGSEKISFLKACMAEN